MQGSLNDTKAVINQAIDDNHLAELIAGWAEQEIVGVFNVERQ